MSDGFWKKCSSCKTPIGFQKKYFVCSVSTCNGQRTGYVFCSVPCFEVHLPAARHKDAGAVEMTSPPAGSGAWTSSTSPSSSNSGKVNANTSGATSSTSEAPRRILATSNSPTTGINLKTGSQSHPREVLVIASRLKEYIDAKSGFNTSASVMDVISDYIRVITDRAIDNARADGRKTVLDRDFR